MRDLFFLSAAEFTCRTGLVEPGPLFDKRLQKLSCTVAVCVRDNGDLVLIDAGLARKTYLHPNKNFRKAMLRLLGLDLAGSTAIVSQLEALGFDAGQVKTIVATHCHFDHIGGLADFPNAELVTTPDELESIGAIGLQPFYRPADLADQARIRTIQLTEPRKYCCPASLDLFGDGEIILLEAEGHSPGHIAAALQGPDAIYIHAGDALFLDWEIGHGFEGPSRLSRLLCSDARALMRTQQNLRRLGSSDDAPIIVSSHDSRIFEQLPHTPLAPASTP